MIIVKQTTTAVNANVAPARRPLRDTLRHQRARTSGDGRHERDDVGRPTSGTGTVNFSNVQGTGSTPKLNQLLKNINASSSGQSYTVSISVRTVNDDGTFGGWTTVSTPRDREPRTPAMALNHTGSPTS